MGVDSSFINTLSQEASEPSNDFSVVSARRDDYCIGRSAASKASLSLGFDQCDAIASQLFAHLRSRLPASLVDDLWLHLLHDYCPLVADRNVLLHV